MTASVVEMLKSSPLVRRLVPERIKTIIRGRPRVNIIPLDEAFPEHEKRHAISSETVPTPEALQMQPCRPAANLLEQSTFSTPEVFTTLLHDVLYCPTNSALLTPSRAVVGESLGTSGVDYPFKSDALYVDGVYPLSGYCTPLRFFRTNHYHTLIDGLPRLHLLNEAPYTHLSEIKLLHTGALSPVEELFIQQMCPDNVRTVALDEGCLYKVEHYILASFLSRQSSGYLPAPYLHAFRNKMLPTRPPRSNKRILISRQRATKRSIKNYEEVKTCVERFGFQEYILEDLPMREQIDLFYDAEMVVAAHGAGLTNLLFAGHRTSVIEIFSTPCVVPHYYYLCKSLGHHYTFIYGDTPDRPIVDFSMDVQQLAAALEEAEASLHNHGLGAIDLEPSTRMSRPSS